MYISDVFTGAISSSAAEDLLQRVRVRLSIVRRELLGSEWNYEICSPFWRLYVNNRSGACIEHEGHRHDLRPGAIHLIPAWVKFRTVLTRPTMQDYIHFYLEGFPASLQRMLFHRPLAITPQGTLKSICTEWQQRLKRSVDRFELADFSWSGVTAQAAITSVFDGLSQEEKRRCFQGLTASTAVQPAIERIAQQMRTPPSNAELAPLCNMSEDHFIRRFKLVTGKTPAQYGLERRIDAAAEMLADRNNSVEQVAEVTGFVDRFHLSRVFKRHTGFPPAEYRKLHRQHRGYGGPLFAPGDSSPG